MFDESERGEDLNVGGAGILLGGDDVTVARHDGLTLGARTGQALGAGIGLQGVVLLNATQEFLTALGGADVLRAQMKALLHLAVADDLVDLHTDGVLGDVENDTSAAVVVGIRHTLLDGGIADDVNVVATLVLEQEPGQGGHTMLAEGLGVLVTRVRAKTTGVRHFGEEVFFVFSLQTTTGIETNWH